jgi:hypothetical protein
MNRAKSELNDWSRPEYKRSDLGKLVRGKYAKRLVKGKSMVILDSDVAEAFPNDKAVNDALRGLISPERFSSRATPRRPIKKVATKRRVA